MNTASLTLTKPPSARNESGFSLLELLAVVTIIVIMSAVAIVNLSVNKKAYAADKQSSQFLDMASAANLQALNQRRNFRLEIDFTDSKLLLIDERGPGTADDTLVRQSLLSSLAEARISETRPTGLLATGLPGYNTSFVGADTEGHRDGNYIVTGHQVWKARFRSDGTVTNAANNVSSSTLYIWPPKTSNSNGGNGGNGGNGSNSGDGVSLNSSNSNGGNGGDDEGNTPALKSQARAITIFGPSGGIRFWRYDEGSNQFVAK